MEYSVQTPDNLKILSREHGDIQVISQLDRADLKRSASGWNIRHLIAYRLLVRPERGFLPTLKPDHDSLCPLCRRDQLSSQQELNHDRTEALIGENPRDLHTALESDLMQLPNGFFWVALARASRVDVTHEAKTHPQRDRKAVERDGYVSSASAIPGSSSPMTDSSSSSFNPDTSGLLDEDENEARRNKPEEVTVQLVTCFLQHVLSLCLVHSATSETEVRARVERIRTNTLIAGNIVVTAEDDGGICRMRRRQHEWTVDLSCLALLEAKRAFKDVYYDNKTGKHSPIASNENLAQCLGEAVITWKENQVDLKEDVFLIAATNTLIRFMHFKFGQDYLEYLNATSKDAQRNIVNNEEKDAFVYMHSTEWFNLQSHDGRRVALCHILALLRWHDNQESLDEARRSSSESVDNQSGYFDTESRDHEEEDDYMDIGDD